MEKEIIECIPTSIASLFESIYLISKKNDRMYVIGYNGEELKVSVPKNYLEIKKYISEYKVNFLDEIETSIEFKEVMKSKDNKEKLVSLITKDDYKLIFVMDLSVKRIEMKNKYTLVIADDSPVITKFFVKIFSSDFDILVAKDGNETINLLENNKDKKIVGLFLDLQMPNKTGFEVLEYFQDRDMFKDIPVTIMSGDDTSDSIKKATSYPVVDMIQKPFSQEAARAIVNKTISFSKNYNN